MNEHTLHRPSHLCPQCGGGVKRVLRTANDKRRWDADDWRRYRCRSASCNWQGLLTAPAQRRKSGKPRGGASILARLGRHALLLLLAGGVAWGCIQALQFMMGP